MKILILEDEPMIQRAYFRMFARFTEVELRVVSSPKEGLQTIDNGFKPNIIFSDWEMPGSTGGDFCKVLRERGETTPIIIVSGQDRSSDIQGTGANECIVKPALSDQIFQMITKWVKS